jgi:phosphoribosylformylglycinamidine synthase
MKVKVFVRLKSGVLDVQGKAVESGLAAQKINDFAKFRIGKLIEFEVEAKSQDEAKAKVADLCEKVLVNTVIESYEIELN